MSFFITIFLLLCTHTYGQYTIRLPQPKVTTEVRPKYSHLRAKTNDTLFFSQWPLFNLVYNLRWLFNAERNQSHIYIFVLDTGSCPEHIDISPLYATWNMFTETPDVTDTYGHGCAVTSIIGARTNNALGMAGLTQGAHIIALKVINPKTDGTFEGSVEILRGIEHAIRMMKEIIYLDPYARFIMNLSFGSLSANEDLDEMVSRALTAGIIVVAAAGNDRKNIDLETYSPAKVSGVISVCATDEDGNIVDNENWGSNYGPQSVFICAPGQEILVAGLLPVISKEKSSEYSSGFAYAHGTSFASPFVVSAIADILDENNGLSLDSIKTVLKKNGSPMGNGSMISESGMKLRFMGRKGPTIQP